MSTSKLMSAVVDSIRARSAIIDAIREDSVKVEKVEIASPRKNTQTLGPAGGQLDFFS